MSARDWDKDWRRQQTREARRESAYNSAALAGQNLFDLEQARAVKLVRAHAELPFFKSLSEQVEAGKSLTEEQVSAAFRIATERGWPIREVSLDDLFHGVGSWNERALEAEQPSLDVVDALEFLENYEGTSPGLLGLKKRLNDPAWVPSPCALRRIERLSGALMDA